MNESYTKGEKKARYLVMLNDGVFDEPFVVGGENDTCHYQVRLLTDDEVVGWSNICNKGSLAKLVQYVQLRMTGTGDIRWYEVVQPGAGAGDGHGILVQLDDRAAFIDFENEQVQFFHQMPEFDPWECLRLMNDIWGDAMNVVPHAHLLDSIEIDKRGQMLVSEDFLC